MYLRKTASRLIALCLAVLILLTAAGCHSTADSPTKPTEVTAEATEEVTEETNDEIVKVTEATTDPMETVSEATGASKTEPATTTPAETSPPATEAPTATQPIETQPVQTDPAETAPATQPTDAPNETPTETQPVTTVPVPPATGAPSTGNGDIECYNHIYSVYTVNPTCTAGGYTISICSVCGHSEINMETAPSHTWSDWVTTKEPTFSEEGEQTHTCLNCGATETQSVEKLPDSEVLDTAALMAYGNSYAAGLGFNVVGGALPGYYPAGSGDFTTMNAAKARVAEAVYATYANLMAAYGTVEGARASVSVWDNGDGTFGIQVYYG